MSAELDCLPPHTCEDERNLIQTSPLIAVSSFQFLTLFGIHNAPHLSSAFSASRIMFYIGTLLQNRSNSGFQQLLQMEKKLDLKRKEGLKAFITQLREVTQGVVVH